MQLHPFLLMQADVAAAQAATPVAALERLMADPATAFTVADFPARLLSLGGSSRTALVAEVCRRAMGTHCTLAVPSFGIQ
jgi:hypothetical protein